MLTHNAAPRLQGEIVVTGAAGFIGSCVVSALLGSGSRVRALVRTSAGAERLRRPARANLATVVVPDLTANVDWDPVLAGASAVVHAAGLAHVRPSGNGALAYQAINVEATGRLALCAARVGARRFIFLSSAKVNGECTLARPFSEEDPPAPADQYARSKLEAERRLADVARASALEPVVLRPPLVYGPGVKANFLRLMQLVRSGVPLPLAAIRNRRSLLYVGNLASAIEACLIGDAAAGKTFFVADDAVVSTPELIRAIAGALRRPARLFRFPLAAMLGMSALARQADPFRRLCESLELDTSRIRSQTGWCPPHTFSEGIAATCNWFAGARS
jgi:nucleoside-diphosphate-sugar epimerase